jgi:hypothetical protein
MTLKEMMNQVLVELGFNQKTEFTTSNTSEAQQIVALANREIRKLAKDNWQALKKQHVITMTTANIYPLPEGYRQFTADTAFSDNRRVDFPASAEEWYYREATGIEACSCEKENRR